MLLNSNSFRDIFLVFHDDIKYTCSDYMQRGFKHCFAIERQALGWCCIDPNRTDLAITLLPAAWDTDIMPRFKQNNPRSTVLHLNVYETKKANYPRLGLISCVSTMQYLIGVYWPHILTPYQLHNKILKTNLKHIKVIG